MSDDLGRLPAARPGPPHQPGRARAEVIKGFEASYTGGQPAPWDIGRPQGVFLELARAGDLQGSVLDVGCGTGEHALLAASFGRQAMGIDVVPRAIELAREKAQARRLPATFRVFDALRLADLGEQFDTVLDCGLFHGFNDEERRSFVDGLARTVRPGGRYHMLCFSDRQPGDWGPRRVTEGELRTTFADGWAVGAVEPAVLDITVEPYQVRAWVVNARRT